MKIIIKNGQVASSKEVVCKKIYIEDSKFVMPFLDEEADEIIDAEGMLILPGAIDVHTHQASFTNGFDVQDDFYDASVAAAAGGTTTYINFVIQNKGAMPVDCLKAKKEEAERDSAVDFSFHLQFTDVNEKSIAQLKDVIDMGVTSVKIFLAFSKSGYKVDDYMLLELLKLSKKYGFVLSAHCENEELINANEERLLQEGKDEFKYYPESRPVYSEVSTIQKAINFAKEVGAKIYIVHLSSGQGLEEAIKAKDNAIVETCIQYLALDDTKFAEDGSFKYLMAPPLRKQYDIDRLWKGILDGDVSVVATDHCPFAIEHKNQENYTKVPLGVPGIESLLPIVYSAGVAKGRIPVTKLVSVLSENPAEIFGLENKGKIQPGYDADFVMFDPNDKFTVKNENVYTKSKYSLYDGQTLYGKVKATYVRGKAVFADDKFLGEKGYGKFIARKPEF